MRSGRQGCHGFAALSFRRKVSRPVHDDRRRQLRLTLYQRECSNEGPLSAVKPRAEFRACGVGEWQELAELEQTLPQHRSDGVAPRRRKTPTPNCFSVPGYCRHATQCPPSESPKLQNQRPRPSPHGHPVGPPSWRTSSSRPRFSDTSQPPSARSTRARLAQRSKPSSPNNLDCVATSSTTKARCARISPCLSTASGFVIDNVCPTRSTGKAGSTSYRLCQADKGSHRYPKTKRRRNERSIASRDPQGAVRSTG